MLVGDAYYHIDTGIDTGKRAYRLWDQWDG